MTKEDLRTPDMEQKSRNPRRYITKNNAELSLLRIRVTKEDLRTSNMTQKSLNPSFYIMQKNGELVK